MKSELGHQKRELNAMPPEASHDHIILENAWLRGDLLTVSRRISHDLQMPLGGIISKSYEPRSDGGSCFYFTLPV
jgi:hypothetical protein